jgi:hypothetical protein
MLEVSIKISPKVANKKQRRSKLAQQRLNDDLNNTIIENDRKCIEMFNISKNQLKTLLNTYTYSEIIKS